MWENGTFTFSMGLRIRIRRDPDSIVLHLNISKRKMMMSSSCNSTMASSFPNPLLFLLSHNSETLDSLHPHLPFIFLLLFLFLFAFLILYKLKPKTLITKQMPLLPPGPAPWPSWEPAWIIHKKGRHSGGYLGFRKNWTMRSHASNWAMSMSFPWFRLRLEGSFWRNMMQCLHPDLFQWSPITWADSWPQSFRHGESSGRRWEVSSLLRCISRRDICDFSRRELKKPTILSASFITSVNPLLVLIISWIHQLWMWEMQSDNTQEISLGRWCSAEDTLVKEG